MFWDTEYGVNREVKCYIVGDNEFSDVKYFGTTIKAQVQWLQFQHTGLCGFLITEVSDMTISSVYFDKGNNPIIMIII